MSLMMMGIGSAPKWGPPSASASTDTPPEWGPGIHIFTAAWCGHCHTMKARNEKFAAVMKGMPHTVIEEFGKGFQVICHELTEKKDTDEATKQGFIYNGFPAIMFKYDSGKIEAFEGDRVISRADYAQLQDENGNDVEPPTTDMMTIFKAKNKVN
jgi:thiol-disulfide isomerase/thioredoxin